MKKNTYKNISYVLVISLVLVSLLFLFNTQNKNDKNIILFKCGSDLSNENVCVQLYPEESKYTDTTRSSILTPTYITTERDYRYVMNCPLSGGTGSEYGNCHETLTQDGCVLLENDYEDNRFFALMEC